MRVVPKAVIASPYKLKALSVFAFPRNARLTERADFDYVFTAPDQRSSDRYFTVLGRFRTLQTEPAVRLGMVVAKKRIHRAHERNQIKRRIRESFRTRQFSDAPLDILVLPKTSVIDADREALNRSLEKHWQRVCRH